MKGGDEHGTGEEGGGRNEETRSWPGTTSAQGRRARRPGRGRPCQDLRHSKGRSSSLSLAAAASSLTSSCTAPLRACSPPVPSLDQSTAARWALGEGTNGRGTHNEGKELVALCQTVAASWAQKL
ncbi:unnamed protein product [Prorocentrum cordatum]|uniref:Uncharacterized protein n=1 Tax=Prorocentrum cordatum TaxID=2364126 RepID=A0ABN9X690_9DINO|nr:unnamed protein product [Polarella glacialis]